MRFKSLAVFAFFCSLAAAHVLDVHLFVHDDKQVSDAGVDTTASCYWDGTAPFCAGGCPGNYVECNRGSCGDGACCWTGYKVYCCQGSCPSVNTIDNTDHKKPNVEEQHRKVEISRPKDVEDAASCYWDGTSPFCAGGCPSGYVECNRNSCGDGACCWTGYKVYCCQGTSCPASVPGLPEPKPKPQVEQQQKVEITKPKDVELDTASCYWDGTSPFCAGGCPSGYVECNRNSCGDGACCWTGYKVYCCRGTSCSASLPEPKTKPKKIGASLAGDYDDICKPEGEILCCPPGAGKNEDCKCVEVSSARRLLTGRGQHPLRPATDDDLCKEGEQLCCNPGARSNEECGCVPTEMSREL